MSKTAFVSGATGFIAQHLVKLLLSKNYKVVGSVRSAAKGEHLKTLFKTGFSYEVVTDLTANGAFDKALINNPDVSVFFHTASPIFFGGSKDVENELLKPAVEGTKTALRAVKDHGKNVHRFVLTSSIAAVYYVKKDDPTRVYNEDTWTDITWEEAVANGGTFGYVGSKTLAERAAWDFIKSEKPGFDFATVNPAFVLGPQAFDSEVKDQMNATAEFINTYLKLKSTDPLPVTKGSFYDVRDVARAHLVAGESKEAINQRLLLINGAFTPQILSNLLRKNFSQLKDTVPVGQPDLKEDLRVVTRGIADDSKTRKILGFEPISLEQSVVDSVSQVLKSRL